jgi:mannitol/fructose-specific phosphotransferase system IIA component (Ntr-type)
VFLSQLLAPDRVLVPLTARDKSGVLRELTSHLVAVAGGDEADVLHAVREREESQCTGYGNEVAIPHGRSPTLPGLAVVAGVSHVPVEYGAMDGRPVRLFFLVAGPESAAGQQVRVLARIARLVRRAEVRERLMRAATPADFVQVVRESEERVAG